MWFKGTSGTNVLILCAKNSRIYEGGTLKSNPISPKLSEILVFSGKIRFWEFHSDRNVLTEFLLFEMETKFLELTVQSLHLIADCHQTSQHNLITEHLKSSYSIPLQYSIEKLYKTK